MLFCCGARFLAIVAHIFPGDADANWHGTQSSAAQSDVCAKNVIASLLTYLVFFIRSLINVTFFVATLEASRGNVYVDVDY